MELKHSHLRPVRAAVAGLGVLAHDVGIFGDNIEDGVDIVGEVLFKSPDIFSIIGSPRPTLGVSVNTAGRTDYAYFDLTWTAALWRPIPARRTTSYRRFPRRRRP